MAQQNTKTITITLHECMKCSYVWKPQSSNIPKQCPRCKRADWQQEDVKPNRRVKVWPTNQERQDKLNSIINQATKPVKQNDKILINKLQNRKV